MSSNDTTAPRFVAYVRVSTKQQGASGLGLAAQRDIIKTFAKQSGGAVIAEFIEVETGKKNDRPELGKALRLAKKEGATLLVGKLDRLSRNLAFTAALIESGAEFRACDCPYADRLTTQMLAVLAEWEARQISKRTREALAAAKAKGTRLGNPRINDINHQGRKVQADKAQQTAETLADIVLPLHRQGRSLRFIASRLAEQGIKTTRGGTWSASHIRNIIKRTEAA